MNPTDSFMIHAKYRISSDPHPSYSILFESGPGAKPLSQQQLTPRICSICEAWQEALGKERLHLTETTLSMSKQDIDDSDAPLSPLLEKVREAARNVLAAESDPDSLHPSYETLTPFPADRLEHTIS